MMLCCCCCCNLRDRIQPWIRDYDSLQSFAVFLIYIQIGCALIGSLGASYNGVSLINLAIALFALVAIESSSQSLGRTYAFLLFCSILLDISWFILFTHEIWNISSADYAKFFIFSLKLTLSMQIVGFIVRLSSSLLWIQIYRLGASYVDTSSRAADFDLRSSFLSPVTPAVARQISDSNEILGGSIYDPAYYSSLFEDSQENKSTCGTLRFAILPVTVYREAIFSTLAFQMYQYPNLLPAIFSVGLILGAQSSGRQSARRDTAEFTTKMPNHDITPNGSTSATGVSQKTSMERPFQAVDEENV